MKITGNQIANFLQKPSPDIKSILVYGNDDNLIYYRAQAILKYYKAQEYSSQEIENPTESAIENMLTSTDFFARGSIIMIPSIQDKIFALIKHKIENIYPNNILLFTCTEIQKNPKLREYHETSGKNAAAIPCYPLETNEIRTIITNSLNAHQIKPENPEVITYFIEKIGSNIFDIQSELDKIIILKHSDKILRMQDITGGKPENDMAVFDAVDAIFSKNIPSAAIIIQENQDLNQIALLRATYRYAAKLLIAQTKIAQGSNPQNEAKIAGIFFKKIDLFTSHLKLWDVKHIHNLIITLAKIETNIKLGHNIIPLLINCLQK